MVVDNIHDARGFQTELDNCKTAIHFRETLIRDQRSWEERERKILRASLDKHDVINLQFTRYRPRPYATREKKHINLFLARSGTTGYPKAVSLTHHNLLNNALSIGDCMRLTEHDVLCNVPPLFHCFDKWSCNSVRLIVELILTFHLSTFGPRKPRGVLSRVVHRLPV